MKSALMLGLALVIFCHSPGVVTITTLKEGERAAHFRRLVRMADHIFSETESPAAASDLIKAAFQVCPFCKGSQVERLGAFSTDIFAFDDLVDRLYLTEKIVPAIIDEKPGTALWVGVGPFTVQNVYQLKSAGIDVSTIEPNPHMAIYGSSTHHMTASIEELGSHVEAGFYDVIIINGIIGWDIDTEARIEEAVWAMHKHMSQQGVLVVGHNRGQPGNCCNFAPDFTPHTLGGLPIVHEDPESEWKHVYEFFTRS